MEAPCDRACSIVDELLATMAAEQAAAERLLEMCAVERQAIMTGDIAELSQAVDEKERVITRISRLERQGNQLIEQLASSKGADGSARGLERLVSVVTDDEGRELISARSTLETAVRKATDANRANAMLVEGFLRTTEDLLQCLSGLDQSTYSPAGQLSSRSTTATTSINCRV